MFKNMRLRTKIWLGFASVSALLVGVAWAGWQGISKSSKGFTSYRELARDSNLCGQLQANMLMVRMNVKDFLINSEPKEIEQYQEYLEKTEKHLAEAQREIGKPDRAEGIDAIEQSLAQYREGFTQVIEQQNVRNQILDNELNTIGPQIERNLTNIMRTAREDDDVEAGFLAGTALRRLLLGRLYVVKYFSSKSSKDIDRVNSEFKALEADFAGLDAALQNPERRELLAKSQVLNSKYQNAFARMIETTRQRESIVNTTLDRLGPMIASTAEEVKLSVKQDQDALGPQLKTANVTARSTIAIVGVAALLASIAISWFLSRIITLPLSKLVVGIQTAEANNDLTVRFDARSNDEIGVMAKSLNQFFNSLHDAVSKVGGSTKTVSTA
ncbi:MAG: HAMP domain-containing protein, partial [Planctomycetota bacterium]